MRLCRVRHHRSRPLSSFRTRSASPKTFGRRVTTSLRNQCRSVTLIASSLLRGDGVTNASDMKAVSA
jgi:hypothetical protein